MQKLVFIILIIIANNTFAQNNLYKNTVERKGFIIGLGLGAGTLSLNTNDTSTLTFSTTLPNIKIGYLINERLALFAILPGANYKYKGNDRGFEGIVVAAQYWIKDKWWVNGGAGLTFDAPAFYTVDDLETAEFYTGFPSLSFATAYEIWQKGKFALDLQYRVFYGKSNIPNGHRKGFSNMFIIGFNWY